MIENTRLETDNNSQILGIAQVLYGFFMVASCLMFLTTVQKLPWVETLQTPILVVSLLTLGLLWLLRRQTLGVLLGQGALLGLALGYWVLSRQYYPLFLIILLLALPYGPQQITRFLKLDLSLKIGLVLILFFLSTQGLIENHYVLDSDRLGLIANQRLAFGFNTPNQFGVMIFSICVEWLYLTRQRLWPTLITTGVMLLTYRLSGARTAFVGFIIFVVLGACFKSNLVQKLLRSNLGILLIGHSYTWLLLLSGYFVYLYQHGAQVAFQVNELLSGRIELAAAYLQVYGLQLWPRQLQEIQSSNIWSTLDNQYMRLLITDGLLCTLIFLVGMAWLIRRLLKRRAYSLVALLLAFAVAGLMESQLFVLNINFTWLIIGLQARYKYLVPNRIFEKSR